jgi:hypothetical protein
VSEGIVLRPHGVSDATPATDVTRAKPQFVTFDAFGSQAHVV